MCKFPGAGTLQATMSIRRALLAASTVAALAVPAAPASAQEIIDCSPTFLVGPVACAVESQQQQISDDPPVVECRVTFLIGPVMCRAERTISEVTDPDNT